MNRSRRLLVLASDNRGKLAEMRQLLATLDVELLPQSRFGTASAEESGSTFLENALIKARHASAVAGLPAIADDSGLEVRALGGRPGVHSARYAGPAASDRQNIDKLLAELGGTDASRRQARFRTVAVYVDGPGDPAPLVAEGAWDGLILEQPRGSAGFGYDPVFYDPELGLAAAEMSSAEKNRVSHRGQAMAELAALLARRLSMQQ